MRVSGKAIIKIHGTDQTYEVEGKHLDFNEEEGREREMGIEKHYVANLEHLQPNERKGTFELSVWEYPVGEYNDHGFSIESDEVIEDSLDFDFSEEL